MMTDKVLHFLTFVVAVGSLLALILTGHDPQHLFGQTLGSIFYGAVGATGINSFVAAMPTKVAATS